MYAEGADLVKTTPKPQLHVSAKKALSLLDGPRTVATVKAFGNFDPQSGQVRLRRGVQHAVRRPGLRPCIVSRA